MSTLIFIAASEASAVALRTIGLAVGFGLLLTVASRRLKLPTIVLLLIGGFIFGPELLGWVEPESLGDLLPVVISLAVGIILFEGGLTLKPADYLASSVVIKRLLSVGVLVTWLLTALIVWLCTDFSFSFALLAGSLVIVTGPTVIVPLLKRIKAQDRVASILHWEGVLIDTVGVFIAVLCFDFFIANEAELAFYHLFLRIATGVFLGLAGGWLIQYALRSTLIPDNLVNGFALASAVLLFVMAEMVASEAGILTVTIAGFVIGLSRPEQLNAIRAFKSELTDLLIGMLFLLLVARLELQQFINFGITGALALLVILLVVRPANIFLSTIGTDLNLKEKLFLSWVAPRGIVAASLASLFAISYQGDSGPSPESEFLESFTYSVICATVIIQGLSAGWIAKLLGLQRPPATGWLIVGAHQFGRDIAQRMAGLMSGPVTLIDSNERNVHYAKDEGLTALRENALDLEALSSKSEILPVGFVLALTDNVDLNRLIVQTWGNSVGSGHVYGWNPEADMQKTRPEQSRSDVFRKVARPTVISGELRRGEANLEVVSASEYLKSNDSSKEVIPLILFDGGKVYPVNELPEADEVANDANLLLLRRASSYLDRALKNGGLLELGESKSLNKLYDRLIGEAVNRFPRLSRDQLLEDLTAQEKLFPAFLGHGIAVPHVHSESIEQRICLLAHIPAPGAPIASEEDCVQLVFFIISPAGDPEGHLATLAEIARFCHDASNRDALLSSMQSRDYPRAFERLTRS